jgi:hypothetical protein
MGPFHPDSSISGHAPVATNPVLDLSYSKKKVGKYLEMKISLATPFLGNVQQIDSGVLATWDEGTRA